MIETWRWFGPDDPVTLAHVRQSGATGVVSALHHMNQGRAWPAEEVAKRKAEIEAAGLTWSVVESIAVSESIKTRTGEFRALIEAYKDSIRAVARAGVRTICYNFMAVTDWTRTDLDHPLPSGGTALRFDWTDLAAYDLFVLRRPGAEADHPPARIAAAEARFRAMSEGEIDALTVADGDGYVLRDCVAEAGCGGDDLVYADAELRDVVFAGVVGFDLQGGGGRRG